MHKKKSEFAGKTARIKEHISHPQVDKFGGSEIEIEDWWDRIFGSSWMWAKGNPVCMVYSIRTGLTNNPLPTDDEVLYGKIGGLGHLVHIKELEDKS